MMYSSAIGQTYLIKGKILDSRSGDPLIGANIISSAEKYISGIQGDFTIQLKKGDSLKISYISYLDLMIYYDNLNEEKLENFVVYMESSNTILETATITGSKFEKRLSEATVSVEVIKPSLIKSTNTTSTLR